MKEIARNGTKMLSRLILDVYNKHSKELTKKLSAHIDTSVDGITNITKEYVDRFAKKNRAIKVLFMQRSADMYDIYIPARVIEITDIFPLKNAPDNIDKYYSNQFDRSFWNYDLPIELALSVANEIRFLTILGGPGSGKTTFLKKLGLDALDTDGNELVPNSYNHTCIPVFIELKQFRYEGMKIFSAIIEEFKGCGLLECDVFIEELLDDGKLLILLDGLDEVPNHLSLSIHSEIQKFCSRYPKNRYVLSCRTAAYRFNFQDFTDYEISEFRPYQITEFVNKWFQNLEKQNLAVDCLAELNSNDHLATKELTHTPLLLTLVCLLYQKSGHLPQNRSILYRKALNVLLEEWNAAKEIPPDILYKGLNIRQKEILLSEIAYDAFNEDEIYMDEFVLSLKVESILNNMLSDDISSNGKDVLRSIQVQHGLLVKRTESKYTFLHLTFQEYLAAQRIAENDETIKSIIETRVLNRNWVEVIILLSGLMSRSDKLLEYMKNYAISILKNNSKVYHLLQWATRIINTSDSNDNLCARRSTAIYIARTFARAFRLTDIIDTKLHMKIDTERADYRDIYRYKHEIIQLAVDISKRRGIDIYTKFRVLNEFASSYTITEGLNYAVPLIHCIQNSQIFENIDFASLEKSVKDLKNDLPTYAMPREESLDFRDKIASTFFKAFHLEADILRFEVDDMVDLRNYLYVMSLIFRAKDNAIRVTKSKWINIQKYLISVSI